MQSIHPLWHHNNESDINWMDMERVIGTALAGDQREHCPHSFLKFLIRETTFPRLVSTHYGYGSNGHVNTAVIDDTAGVNRLK